MITVKELLEMLSKFNPNAEVSVKVLNDRYSLYAIPYSWSAYDGECYERERDITKEKLLTSRVTLEVIPIPEEISSD